MLSCLLPSNHQKICETVASYHLAIKYTVEPDKYVIWTLLNQGTNYI